MRYVVHVFNIFRSCLPDTMKGNIPPEILAPLIDSLPLELTLIDADDKYIMWSQLDQEIFHRPDDILGKDVMVCHPRESHDKIRRLLEGMKSGEIDKHAHVKDCTGPDGGPARIRMEYRALRDAGGTYQGCVEICQYLE